MDLRGTGEGRTETQGDRGGSGGPRVIACPNCIVLSHETIKFKAHVFDYNFMFCSREIFELELHPYSLPYPCIENSD